MHLKLNYVFCQRFVATTNRCFEESSWTFQTCLWQKTQNFQSVIPGFLDGMEVELSTNEWRLAKATELYLKQWLDHYNLYI